MCFGGGNWQNSSVDWVEGEEREFWLGVIETQISINSKKVDYLP